MGLKSTDDTPGAIDEDGGRAPAARRGIPLGLLGMIGLALLVETFVAGHPIEFSDPVSLNWRLSAEDARERAPGAEILCVGDSLVKHSVIPGVVEARIGRKTSNLAAARGPSPITYFLLRRALEAGAKPSAVVLNFKPGVLVGSPRYNLRYFQEVLTPGECLDLVKTGGGGSLLTELAIGRALPSFRSRHEIRGAITAAFRGEDNPLRLTNQICQRNWRVNDGANVAARNPAFTGEVDAAQHKTLLSDRWYCHRVNQAYVRKILDLTAERRIPVYWILPPLSPQLQARRESSGAEAGYLAFVRAFEARYPHIRIVDGRHAGYGPDVFVDATHLDGQGAHTLSVDLAEILARDLAAPSKAARWSKLPDYRALPAATPLEDVEQSRRVVRGDLPAGNAIRR